MFLARGIRYIKNTHKMHNLSKFKHRKSLKSIAAMCTIIFRNHIVHKTILSIVKLRMIGLLYIAAIALINCCIN